MLINTELIGDLWTGDIRIISQYVKTTIIYQKKENYYDLYTNQKYKKEIHGLETNGTMFINFKKGLIPLRDVINFEKTNMTKHKFKQLVNTNQATKNLIK